jgi:hypothetical protein
MYCLAQYFSFTAQEIGDGGPNHAYKYVTSISHSSAGKPTAYSYVISPDLENSGSQFYQAQCDNYDEQTGLGFISGATLLANTIQHESGSSGGSHYAQYTAAQNNPNNNLGTVAEQQTADPSVDLGTFINNTHGVLDSKRSAIQSTTDVEPCGGCGTNCNGGCVFQGAINFSPYQSCN